MHAWVILRNLGVLLCLGDSEEMCFVLLGYTWQSSHGHPCSKMSKKINFYSAFGGRFSSPALEGTNNGRENEQPVTGRLGQQTPPVPRS